MNKVLFEHVRNLKTPESLCNTAKRPEGLRQPGIFRVRDMIELQSGLHTRNSFSFTFNLHLDA